MIILIAVLAILALIAGVGFYVSQTELAKSQMKVDELEQENTALTLKLNFKQAKEDEQQETAEVETGHHVKRRFYRPITAGIYRNTFDIDPSGQRILEHLTALFCKGSYVRGGQDAERESCFRAGQNSVVSYIIKQINRANDPNYIEEILHDRSE